MLVFPERKDKTYAESAAFTVTVAPPISTDKSSYAPGETITVTYSGLPGNQRDWIGIAVAGSPNESFLTYVYTGGQTSGTATFTAPLNGGSYVARSFPNDTPTSSSTCTRPVRPAARPPSW